MQIDLLKTRGLVLFLSSCEMSLQKVGGRLFPCWLQPTSRGQEEHMRHAAVCQGHVPRGRTTDLQWDRSSETNWYEFQKLFPMDVIKLAFNTTPATQNWCTEHSLWVGGLYLDGCMCEQRRVWRARNVCACLRMLTHAEGRQAPMHTNITSSSADMCWTLYRKSHCTKGAGMNKTAHGIREGLQEASITREVELGHLGSRQQAGIHRPEFPESGWWNLRGQVEL